MVIDHHHYDYVQVGSSLGQNDLLAEESGPLLPSVLPAPEVNKSKLRDQNSSNQNDP